MSVKRRKGTPIEMVTVFGVFFGLCDAGASVAFFVSQVVESKGFLGRVLTP